MSDYFAVIQLTPPLDHDGVRRLSRHSCLDIHQVQWLRSYVASDFARMLCWYQALDAESVRLVLRQMDSIGTEAWSAEIDDDTEQVTSDDNGERVVAEIELTEPGPEAMTTMRSAAVAALADANQNVTCSFTSTNGPRLILVTSGEDETVVTACLRSASIKPASVWRCVELDPHPSRLFTATTPTTAQGIERDLTPVNDDVDFDAVIIGAGISGICALQKLAGMGLEVRLYESAGDVGGVWYWNRYPGARVDSETYTYGFSFSDELLQEWDWQELFSPQPEIQRYLQHVVAKFDLRRHMEFDTRINAAVYEEHGGRWLLETDRGERVTARYLIAATGSLTAPQLPDYPGIDEFAGESHHTARWPATGVDLAGKRVGVIGTGASGVQVIQAIADDVAHLTVFQRTPTYCVPQRNRPLNEEARRQIRRDWDNILKACRESYGGFIHTFDPRSGLAVTAEEREAKFEELWQTPGFAFWFGNFADLLMNLEVNAHASDFVRRKITERVNDPKATRKLLPDHPFGTKRIPLENGYYEIYNRDNVRLVDLRETPIERITPNGIRASNEDHRLDVIVYATGFDAGTGALTRIEIRGEGGITIEEKWRDGPKTFLGLLVGGFPNMFIVNGPHNAAALSNAGRCIEQNVDWIARCIERLRAQGLTRIAPTASAEEEWTKHVYDAAGTGVLTQMTNSWFFGANTPGKPRRAIIYAPGAREYREHCEDVARAGYPGCTMY
jgi:cation diffusion facilitator CzcD-associated flavoprotein CzcO